MGTSTIRSSGTTIDDILEPRTTTKISDVGIKEGGIDISNIYEKLASGTAPSALNIKSGGADLNTFFAAIGTVSSGTIVWAGDTESMVSNQGGTLEIFFKSTGSIKKKLNFGSEVDVSPAADWLEDSTTGSDYEMNAISSNGIATSNITITTGNTTWTTLGSDIWFRVADGNSSFPSKTDTITIKIRENSTPATEVSATLTMTANYLI